MTPTAAVPVPTEVLAFDEPGERVVASVAPLTVEGQTFLDVRVDEPLTPEVALTLARVLRGVPVTAATVARSASSMTEAELRASAHRRIEALSARHGIDSPEVAAALARWGALLDARDRGDDLFALVESLRVPR